MKTVAAILLLTVVTASAFDANEADYARDEIQDERTQLYARRRLTDQPQERGEVSEQVQPEVQNYDTAVARPHCWMFCCCRRKRSLFANSAAFAKVLGSDAELKLYSTYVDLQQLHDTPVARADLYERPLAGDASAAVKQILGEKQLGVVATLNDGRRFLLIKGNQLGRGKETVAIISDHMTDEWVKVATKQINKSTFRDFYVAGGSSYRLLGDNGNQAAERMMALE